MLIKSLLLKNQKRSHVVLTVELITSGLRIRIPLLLPVLFCSAFRKLLLFRSFRWRTKYGASFIVSVPNFHCHNPVGSEYKRWVTLACGKYKNHEIIEYENVCQILFLNGDDKTEWCNRQWMENASTTSLDSTNKLNYKRWFKAV